MTDLFKEEYQTLRKEVEVAMAELNLLESACLAAVAGIFVWLAANRSQVVFRLAWFLPSALVAFCILRVWSISRHLGWLGEYLQKYEELHLRPAVPGWEHFLSEGANGGRPRRGFRGRITSSFWAVLLGASLFFG